MPIYSYRCDHCGHRQDVLQKMSDSPLTVCPECGETAFKKQVTAAGFQLKGSGWYVTDFRSPPAPAGAKKSDDAAPASASETPAKASDDAKPTAKPTTDAQSSAPAPAPKPTPSTSND